MGTLNNVKRHAVRSGTLRRVVMNMYPPVTMPDGTLVYPAVWLEHLGHTNESWMLERLAEAGKVDDEIKAIRARAGGRTLADIAKTWEEEREQLLRHGVRKIEGWYFDGVNGDPDPLAPVPSNSDGIRAVVEAWDESAVGLAVRIAVNPENFRDAAPVPALPAGDVAKK